MFVCENVFEVRLYFMFYNSCIGIKLCIMLCDGEVKIGEIGFDGC